MATKITLLDRIKAVVEAVKAARMLWTLIALVLAYAGYNESSRPVEPAIRPDVKQVNWLPIIKEEISKSNKSHSREHHGGS